MVRSRVAEMLLRAPHNRFSTGSECNAAQTNEETERGDSEAEMKAKRSHEVEKEAMEV